MEKKGWNKFVTENNGLFLQSWEWGEFQKSLGRKVWRIAVPGELAVGSWQLVATIVRHDLPLGKNYLYCPGGPVIKLKSKNEKVKIIEKFLGEVKKIAKQEKSIFLKIEPFWEDDVQPSPFCHSEGDSPKNLTGDEILKPSGASARGGSALGGKALAGRQVQDDIGVSGFIKSKGIQRIKKTLILDLAKSEEELLAEMKQKTRYNIKLAERHGAKIRISDNPEKDIEYFWNLAKQTGERDGFRLHPKEYYEKQISFCHPEPAERRAKDLVNENGMNVEIPRFTRNNKLCVKLFLAEYQGRVIATNIVVFFGSQAIYLHGASANEHRNLMAPYLLQWEQIKEAKKRGCEIYDFWGIDEEKWPGITRFKKGFGGENIFYIGAYDYVFDRKWYFLYNLARRIKKC